MRQRLPVLRNVLRGSAAFPLAGLRCGMVEAAPCRPGNWKIRENGRTVSGGTGGRAGTRTEGRKSGRGTAKSFLRAVKCTRGKNGGGGVQFPLEFEKRTWKYNQKLEELFLKSGKRAAIIVFDSRNNSGIAEKGGFCRTNPFPHFMEYGRRFRHRKAGGPFRCAPGWGKEPAESFRRIA